MGAIISGFSGAIIGGVIGLIIIRFIRRIEVPRDNKRRYLKFDEKSEAMRRAGNCCEECGIKENLSVHHIIPLSKGGTNDMKNLTILCRSCNSRKGNR